MTGYFASLWGWPMLCSFTVGFFVGAVVVLAWVLFAGRNQYADY